MKDAQSHQPSSLDLWLGKPAPRYTSYPPAPFFHSGITSRDYIKSLKKLASEDQPVNLYIHIPFCKSLCLYCGCNTIVTNRPDRITNYLNALMREIEMISVILGRRRIESLHFGGGTPNTLSDTSMRALFDCLKENFDLTETREIAMEIDPRVTSLNQAQLLADCGVTRVSLGVQDFDPTVQATIHRIQPYELVAHACEWLRTAGIIHINLDLIYGLPKQTPDTIAETARLVSTLSPDRIALFSYAHVPQLKKHQAALEPSGIPDMHKRLELELIARNALINFGYKCIGIDHFTKNNDSLFKAWHAHKLNRNFQGYTENGATPLIGLGASSISQNAHGYFQNERDARLYQESIHRGHLSVRRGFLLSREDRVRSDIIEQLMCYMSCDVRAICTNHNLLPEHFLPELEALKSLKHGGIISLADYVISLTAPNRMAMRVVCSFFDAYTGHSSVVASRTA